MVIDSSALIALLGGEAETAQFVVAIAAASSRVVSAPTYLEAAIVISARWGVQAQEKFDRLLANLAIEILPFTHDQAIVAATAYRQYGKGSGHAAELNFGDCFSYALAKLRNEPLLFKGNDFSHTDLRAAITV
ncbi:MAG: type II toxin-antitoxin system VapC family toxin [Alphaproteobacteria bacterium]|nr:MAG: type II toxin-antitoxin system VapC family toxin [Alphaproteobacteria bacterium]